LATVFDQIALLLCKFMEEKDIIYGKNPILEAIDAGWQIDKIFIQQNLRGPFEKDIRALSKTHEIPLVKVPLEKLNQLTKSNKHQGVLAFVSAVKFQDLQDVISSCFDRGENPLIIVLEGVTDMRNLAAISRSSLIFGAHAIALISKNSPRISEDLVKISMGAILKIPVCRLKNMIQVSEVLKDNGISLMVTDVQTDYFIDQVDFSKPCAIVMGSEHTGVTLETKRAADIAIKIPQAENFDSLNVSVAAGVILYEIQRQRRLS